MNLKSISIETTSEAFSAYSGQKILNDLWKSLKLDKKLKFTLPRKKRKCSVEQVNKLKALVLSFCVGNDSLSDIDTLRKDKLFRKIIGGSLSSSSLGDFLRSFDRRHLEKLQEALIEATIELRLALFPDDRKFVLTMDSTPHEHYAKKMEGLAWNYKNMWCLDSQNAYDQYGFSYLFELRPGNTFSAKGSEHWVHNVFKKVPTSHEKWFRADSAYGKYTVYEALKMKNVNFVIALKENIGRYVRKKNKNMLTWEKTRLRFFNSNKCEVAMGLYPIKKLGLMRVVFIRAPKEDVQIDLLEDYSEGAYAYYSFITNVSGFDMSAEEVINFYRQRSTAENYIKEQKYGYDFLNFPCQKLKANQAFGLAGTIAHNLMRTLSFMMEQKIKVRKTKTGKKKRVKQLGYYAKKVRSELINIAGKVTCSARKVKLRVNQSNWEVFEKVMYEIKKLKQRYVPYKTLSEFFDNRIIGTTDCTIPSTGDTT